MNAVADRSNQPVLLIALAIVGGLLPIQSLAQRPAAATDLVIGIDGHYRAGHWTAVRFAADHEQTAIDAIETRDGDGSAVLYRQPGGADWGYAIPGSQAAPLTVYRSDGGALTTRFPSADTPTRPPAMIPRQMPWIVAVGDPLGIESIGANELLQRDASVAVTRPASARSLPDSSAGYDGVDLLVIERSGIELLRGLDRHQQAALRSWVVDGGHVLLMLGESSEAMLAAAPWLIDLLPIDEISVVRIDPAAVESFTATQRPLAAFDGASLPVDKGTVVLMGKTTRRVATPIAAAYSIGFGQVTVVTADLGSEMFRQWPQRLDFIARLVGAKITPTTMEFGGSARSTSYDDLAGQLRASLDRFAVQRKWGFSVVSLIVLSLLALIGPIDYLVVNRLFGRPWLGWLTMPLIVISVSTCLILAARPAQAPAAVPPLASNRLEIFDIDTVAVAGRGFLAGYLYSHAARQLDIKVELTAASERVCGETERMVTAPLGTPGPAFGGIPIAIEDQRLPVYEVPLDERADLASSSLIGLPLAPRSSKGFVTRCSFQPQVAADAVLTRRPGSELLQGPLVNPLAVDILDGMLIYQNWAYVLPTRFPAGGQLASVEALRQKNFRWRLSRQKSLADAVTENEPWDPADLDALDRIAEMLMFHQTAGGSRYTTLQHQPLAKLDLSHGLSADRCMLVGRLSQPMTQILAAPTAATDPPSRQPVEQNALTFVRVIIPVQAQR